MKSPIDRNLNFGRHCVDELLAMARPFEVVLDVGAGQGADLMLARQHAPDAELHAIELADHACHVLTERGVQVHQIDAERERLPFLDASVDVIISNQTLEHTKEVFWILHEMSRVLTVGGHLLIGVPNLAALHNRLLLLAGRQPSVIKTASAHVRGFSIRDLDGFLEAGFPGGLERVALRGSNFYPFPPSIARHAARAFPTMAWAIFGLWRKQERYTGGFTAYPAAKRLQTPFFLGPPDADEVSVSSSALRRLPTGSPIL